MPLLLMCPNCCDITHIQPCTRHRSSAGLPFFTDQLLLFVLTSRKALQEPI
jgi:hypothetical protein